MMPDEPDLSQRAVGNGTTKLPSPTRRRGDDEAARVSSSQENYENALIAGGTFIHDKAGMNGVDKKKVAEACQTLENAHCCDLTCTTLAGCVQHVERQRLL